MCDVIDNYLKKGELKHATDTVDRMLAKGKLTNEEIADYAGVTLEFVLERAGVRSS